MKEYTRVTKRTSYKLERAKVIEALEENNWNYSVAAMKLNASAAAVYKFVVRHNYFITKQEVDSAVLWKIGMMINNPDHKVAKDGIELYHRLFNIEKRNVEGENNIEINLE